MWPWVCHVPSRMWITRLVFQLPETCWWGASCNHKRITSDFPTTALALTRDMSVQLTTIIGATWVTTGSPSWKNHYQQAETNTKHIHWNFGKFCFKGTRHFEMIALIQLLWPTCFYMVFLNTPKDLSIIFELLKNLQIILKTNIYTQTINLILLTIILSVQSCKA